MAKEKRVIVTGYTPIGILSGMVVLNEPKQYNDDGKDKFFTKFVVEGEEAESLQKDIDAHIVAAQAEFDAPGISNIPYIDHVDFETKEPTGMTEFSFTVRTNIVTRSGTIWDRKPFFVNPDGSLVKGEYPILAAGTKAVIKYEVYAWAKTDQVVVNGRKQQIKGAGVTLQPTHIQVLDAVIYVPGGPTDGGFAAQSGYEALPPGQAPVESQAPQGVGSDQTPPASTDEIPF